MFFAIFVAGIPPSPATQVDAFLQSLSSPNRPPLSVPPPSVPGIPPSPANRSEVFYLMHTSMY